MADEHVVQTRQKDDELFTSLAKQTDGQLLSAPLAMGGTLSLPVRLVLGYSVVRFFGLANQPLLLRIEQAPTENGPWIEVARPTSVPSTDLLGMRFLCVDIGPCGPFMRVFVDNTGAGEANPFWFQGFGHPVAGGGGVGGGGAPATNVNLKDCATDTEASIKPDAGPISPAPCDGGLLIAGRDDAGPFQRHIRVDSAGRIIISPTAGGLDIDGNLQVQTVEALPLLAAAAVFDGASKDNINYEAMSASLTLASTLGTTITIRFQQRATALDTFRDADVIAGIVVPVGGALVNFDRVWSVSRQFGRIQVENTGVNPLTTAELVVMQKPIS